MNEMSEIDISRDMNQIFSILKNKKNVVLIERYFLNLVCLFSLFDRAKYDYTKENLMCIVISRIYEFEELLYNWDGFEGVCVELTKRLEPTITSSVLCFSNKIERCDKFRIFCAKIHGALPVKSVTQITDDQIVKYYKTTQLRAQPGSIEVVLNQLVEEEGQHHEIVLGRSKLLRERQGHPTMSYGSHVKIINFVEMNLIDDFTPEVLARLLKTCYGICHHSLRNTFKHHAQTLYAYLRFALIGPKYQSKPFNSKQMTLTLYSTFQSQTKINEFLSVILEDVPPKTLAEALIGGEIATQELGSDESLSNYYIPPLIFYFLSLDEPGELIISKIQNDPESMNRLTQFVLDGNRPDMAQNCFEKIIKHVKNLGTETELLKKLFARSMQFKQIKAQETLANKASSGTFFSDNTQKNESAVHQPLVEEINECLRDLDKKLNVDSSTDAVELHWQKKRVLLAALQIIKGESVDFKKIKDKNPRYSEGWFSATKEVIHRFENHFSIGSSVSILELK